MYTLDEQTRDFVDNTMIIPAPRWTISKCLLTLFLFLAVIVNVVNIVAAIWLFLKLVFNAQGLKNTLYSLFLTPLYILKHYDIANPKL
jgi:hypothetical protein